MKKLNYITILGLAAGLTFAGNAMAQSGDSTELTVELSGIYQNLQQATQNNGAWYVGNSSSSAFTAVANESPTLTIDYVQNASGKEIKFGFYTKGTDEKFYVTDKNGELISLSDGSGKLNSNALALGNVDSFTEKEEHLKKVDAPEIRDSSWTQTFKANDMVGIWVADMDGNILYQSTLVGSTSAVEKGDHSEGDTWLGGHGNGEGNAPIRFHLLGSGYKTSSSVEAQSTGTPLPGVWATIALAGAASAYLKRRRKENK